MTLTAESSKLTAELTADSNDVQVRVRERGSTEDFIALNFGYGEKAVITENEDEVEVEGKGKKSFVWIAAILMIAVAILITVFARRSQES